MRTSAITIHQVYAQLPKYSDGEAHRYIRNAFVRGYRVVVRRKRDRYSVRTWREYMANFRGNHETDYRRIEADLKAAGILRLSDDGIDPKVAREAEKVTSDLRTASISSTSPDYVKQVVDESKRDGRLVAIASKHRLSREAEEGTAVIVSSSAVLGRVCSMVAGSGESSPLVMPLGSIVYFLSLVPGAHLSLLGFRQLLLAPGFREQLSPLEQKALWIIYESKQYSLPFARRAALHRELIERIRTVAHQHGQRPSDLMAKFENKTEEGVKLFAEIVRDSVDAIALSASEKEIQRLQSQVKQMEEELKRERERRRQ